MIHPQIEYKEHTLAYIRGHASFFALVNPRGIVTHVFGAFGNESLQAYVATMGKWNQAKPNWGLFRREIELIARGDKSMIGDKLSFLVVTGKDLSNSLAQAEISINDVTTLDNITFIPTKPTSPTGPDPKHGPSDDENISPGR